MSSTSHQAKHHRSCRLVPGFASSERAPYSSCRVSKHQNAEPPQGRFANGSEPPAESGSISSPVSTRATPRTSSTKPVSTSPSLPACRRRLLAARLRRYGQRPVSSRRFRLCLKSVPNHFIVLLRPTPTPLAAGKPPDLVGAAVHRGSPASPILLWGCQPRPSRPKQLGQVEASPWYIVPFSFSFAFI
jgi:hypothetical protein